MARNQQRKSGARPGRVRIIGGRWRGRRILVPAGSPARPTPDRVRETLFNWLAPELAGARCLDLYAGTGALGVEALSRGAAEVLFVESDREAAGQLAGLLRELDAAGEVHCADAEATLRRHAARPFDLAFLDPPYATADLGGLCTLLARGWLRPGALVYLETGRAGTLPALDAGWLRWREATAAEVRFGLVRYLGTPRATDDASEAPAH